MYYFLLILCIVFKTWATTWLCSDAEFKSDKSWHAHSLWRQQFNVSSFYFPEKVLFKLNNLRDHCRIRGEISIAIQICALITSTTFRILDHPTLLNDFHTEQLSV